MFVRGLTLSCWSCLQGHRATNCIHNNRPLYALKRKGRPHKSDHLLPLDQNTPHIPNISDTHAFDAFLARIETDPTLKDWYYHDQEPIRSPPSTLKKSPRKKPEDKKPVPTKPKDIYGGSLTSEQFQRWKDLCGLGDLPDNAMVTKEFLTERMHQHFARFASDNAKNPQALAALAFQQQILFRMTAASLHQSPGVASTPTPPVISRTEYQRSRLPTSPVSPQAGTKHSKPTTSVLSQRAPKVIPKANFQHNSSPKNSSVYSHHSQNTVARKASVSTLIGQVMPMRPFPKDVGTDAEPKPVVMGGSFLVHQDYNPDLDLSQLDPQLSSYSPSTSSDSYSCYTPSSPSSFCSSYNSSLTDTESCVFSRHSSDSSLKMELETLSQSETVRSLKTIDEDINMSFAYYVPESPISPPFTSDSELSSGATISESGSSGATEDWSSSQDNMSDESNFQVMDWEETRPFEDFCLDDKSESSQQGS